VGLIHLQMHFLEPSPLLDRAAGMSSLQSRKLVTDQTKATSKQSLHHIRVPSLTSGFDVEPIVVK